MEQTSSRVIRDAGSWYHHSAVTHGFTNRGEVLGSSIGPGSNSHYISFSKLKEKSKLGLSLEIIDQNNDFLIYAFENAKDYRRYWKDYNLHLFYTKRFKNLWSHLNIVYSRSLNYQWGLDESGQGEGYDYIKPGIDENNFFIKLNFTYFLNF